MGWGGEDVDFCYRIFKKKAKFISEQKAYAFHLPHRQLETMDEKIKNNVINLKKMHKKNNSFETELFLNCPYTLDFNLMLHRFNCLDICHLIPKYEDKIIEYVNSTFESEGNNLLIGYNGDNWLSKSIYSHFFVHNKKIQQKLEKCLENIRIHYMLGCDTPFDDYFFNVTVVTDFHRYFEPAVLEAFIKETVRISKKVYFVHTMDLNPVIKRIERMEWTSHASLLEKASKLGLNYKTINLDSKIKLSIISKESIT
ncbi:hypothetical protein VN24_19005 [Paenibacillus beijingensis]|uniref:Methyltransferase type 11 domain-containing protein n=2 Tax=Paenibacillus beijingensis TaxID=1126833 RepID=A0A0D5NLY5_9BACL|nr:hypothetical protein VN24_19005 [Paenibacillus beijingensis]